MGRDKVTNKGVKIIGNDNINDCLNYDNFDQLAGLMKSN